MIFHKLLSINQIQSLIPTSVKNNIFGVVYDVILDENHPIVKDDITNISYVGGIRFRLSTDIYSDTSNLNLALPIDKSIKDLPNRNEVVEVKYYGGTYYYRRTGAKFSINTTTDEELISVNFKETDSKSNTGSSYNKVRKTGISRSNSNSTNKYSNLGEYFEFQPDLHRLKLYEGDTLLESKFGQSIRMSAYNNTNNEFSPTILIRNSENSISKDRSLEFTTEEDVNRDGSTIALTSNSYELNFIPGTVSDKGQSDFETKPKSFKRYPSRLTGDQLLLNSGRIILSAKNGEMIFYSKKNYGFISDGGLSIDNKFGIEISVGDDINILTNDRNVNINSGKGNINLGAGDKLESLVKGDTLYDLLDQLLDAILKQQYLTPSGPTSVGPTNIAVFNTIKSKLRTILSTQNKTV
jgi:hypothetical protein